MKKIIVCDDDIAIREVVGMVIESEFDNEIIYASNAKEAIEHLKKNIDIGLVICDYNMPGGKGSVVFNYNSDAHNVPFIMFTGNGEESFKDIENFKLNPLNVVVHKPWDEDIFFESIRLALEQDDDQEEESEDYNFGDYKKVKTPILFKYKLNDIKLYRKVIEFEYIDISEEEINNSKQFVQQNPYVYITQESFKDLLNAVNKRFLNYKEALKKSSLNTIFNISEAVMDKLIINADTIDISIEEIEELSVAASAEIENL